MYMHTHNQRILVTELMMFSEVMVIRFTSLQLCSVANHLIFYSITPTSVSETYDLSLPDEMTHGFYMPYEGGEEFILLTSSTGYVLVSLKTMKVVPSKYTDSVRSAIFSVYFVLADPSDTG